MSSADGIKDQICGTPAGGKQHPFERKKRRISFLTRKDIKRDRFASDEPRGILSHLGCLVPIRSLDQACALHAQVVAAPLWEEVSVEMVLTPTVTHTINSTVPYIRGSRQKFLTISDSLRYTRWQWYISGVQLNDMTEVKTGRLTLALTRWRSMVMAMKQEQHGMEQVVSKIQVQVSVTTNERVFHPLLDAQGERAAARIHQPTVSRRLACKFENNS